MRIKYQDDMPIVGISVAGKRRENQLNAHIDYAATVTIVPYKTVAELGLEFDGYSPIATGGGLAPIPFYKARVRAFDKNFDLRIGVLDLPQEAGISALVGRDILDSFKVCLNGKTKEIEVSEP